MTATNHALFGGVIALIVKEPVLALPLAFLSHFLVDYIPHYSMNDKYLFKRRFNIYLFFDTLICVIMATLAVVYLENGLLVAVCMFLATSPDFMWAYHKLYREHYRGLKSNFGPIARFHKRIQATSHFRHARRGKIIESIWFIVMTSIILKIG